MIYSTDIEQIGKFLKTHALKGELNAQLEIDSDFLRPEIPIIMDIDGMCRFIRKACVLKGISRLS